MKQPEYWHLTDPKLRNCKHKRMEKIIQGTVVLDYCPDCKFYFHPTIKENLKEVGDILSEEEFRENTKGCFYQDELRKHDKAMRNTQETPMGVSQWRAYGKRYGYWDYFKKDCISKEEVKKHISNIKTIIKYTENQLIQ